jgi:SAM-dependent methyltransferase
LKKHFTIGKNKPTADGCLEIYSECGEVGAAEMKKTMANENKLKPEPDTVYRINIWFWKFTDIFWNPRRHLRNIPLKEGMVAVDYGCGPGRYTLPIAKLVGPKGKVFAVDIQSLAVKTVKEKAARHGLTNIETIMVNSYNTTIQSSSIDIVLLIDTLHLIEDCDALFREIHRLLKQDGILYMDSGHLKMSKAREIVESTGFFTIAEYRDHDMMCAPKDE